MANFIENFWEENKDKWNGDLVTRFPPEPNGYSHIGHAFFTVQNILDQHNQHIA